MSFSQRNGYKPVREVLQYESMDDPLRNGLWNGCIHEYLKHIEDDIGFFGEDLSKNNIVKNLWTVFYKLPVDTLPNSFRQFRVELYNRYRSCLWYEVYDLLEYLVLSGSKKRSTNFIKSCNKTLELEMSSYRFVDGEISALTNKIEIESIEKSLDTNREGVKTHLRQSLLMLSDRQNPDYRNSIKESISAVESLVKQITDEPKATLGKLLKKMNLHLAMEKSFEKLYGFTSDEEGIRHSLLEKDNIDFHDAKFMLVTCSAFVNFVEGKREEGLVQTKQSSVVETA